MINLLELVNIEKNNGYTGDAANAKVCQDLLLKGISESILNRNMTIKGGVVMRSKTNNIRRATQDLDIDFIKYSLSDSSIDSFIEKINIIEGVRFIRVGKIEELSQQDYHGKRVFIKIVDSMGYELKSKIDFGVHNKFEIHQEEYCFDISFDQNGASLLINTNEQMFCEKLRSLLKFGPFSTRYKDIFDMYYLMKNINRNELQICLNAYIFDDDGMRENDMKDIIDRVKKTFHTKKYLKKLRTSNQKWIDVDIEDVLKALISFF